jgi:hypothetical protein
MKACSQVVCLVLVFGVLLAGCSGTSTTPQTVDTVTVPTATPTFLPPSATPLPSATPIPTETVPPPTPTLPPPTETPQPTAAPATPVSSLIPTLGNLPLEGLWHGGGTKLLLDFFVSISDGKAVLTNVGILWEGREECELNARYNVTVPIDENAFTMKYNVDEVAFQLSGTFASNEVVQGVLALNYQGCGDHRINWRAVPKSGISQRP